MAPLFPALMINVSIISRITEIVITENKQNHVNGLCVHRPPKMTQMAYFPVQMTASKHDGNGRHLFRDIYYDYWKMTW